MRRLVCLVAILCLALAQAGRARGEGGASLLWACTIGPIDAGIVDLLEERYESESGIRVRHVGLGTGAALELAAKGHIDLVMAHARSLEERFIKEGRGTERIDLMYNDFVIAGPPEDPAGIRGCAKAACALKRISEKGALFITRGDRSGTHVAELGLWNEAGIKPQGPWYAVYEKGPEGNVATLRYTDERKGYTVIDRATLLTLRKDISLAVLVEKDEALINYISIIPVNPKTVKDVNFRGAMAFAAWLTAPEKGQKVIRDFGKDRYGSPLFFPNSREWRALKQ